VSGLILGNRHYLSRKVVVVATPLYDNILTELSVHFSQEKSMETVILTIYDETAKQEIFDFLKKFKPQQPELKLKIRNLETETTKIQISIEQHPFFGMAVKQQESVQETMNRLK
jgi:hypothetical protein